MRKRSIASVAVLCAAGVAALPPPARAVVVEHCPLAIVRLTSVVDSRTAKVGSIEHFRTVSTYPHIPAGTRGIAIVTFVRQAEPGGRPGQVVLDPRELDLADGTRLGVAPAEQKPSEASGRRRNSYAGTGAIPVIGWAAGAYDATHYGGPGILGPAIPLPIVIAVGGCRQ